MKKLLAVSILATATATSMQANAFKFDTPSDWDIRWDNTLKGNLMYRTENQDPSVYDPNRSIPDTAAQLADDADYSVDQGEFVSQRVDLLSEIDVIWKDKIGFRISGAGWYDFAYNGGSDYPQSGPTKGFNSAYDTWGMLTVQPGEYNDAAKDLAYRGGELLDAFVFANFEIGSASANVRLGRHTLYWGQSFLSTGAIHSFAGSMAAIDVSKGFGSPGSEVKELFIPNDKISTVVQLNDKITFNAFYALGFEPLRWPAGGTYFSLNEALTEHSECLTAFAGDGPAAPRTCLRAVDYKSNDSGDWGVNLQYYIEPWDLETAFIYMNNTDRVTSGLYSTFFDNTPAEVAEAANTNATLLGHYGWVYKSDIKTMGISLAKQMFDISWGADFVYRKDNALNPDLSATLGAPSPGLSSVDPDGNYPGPTGDTAHIVLNGLGFLSPDWGLWDGGTYIMELAMSTLLDFGDREELANPFIKENKFAANFSGVFKPVWYQVRPGWDLSAPTSISYTFAGKQAPISAGGNEKVGNGSIGLEIDVEQTWTMALKYNVFFGPQPNGTAAFIKDRDNLSLTVKRVF